MKTAYFQPIQFGQQLLKFPQVQIQFRSHLPLRGSAAQIKAELALCLFHPPRFSP